VLRTTVFVVVVTMAFGLCGQAAGKSDFASAAVPADRMNQYADLAVEWEKQYLHIDTTNPPGNEKRSAEFFKKIFDAEGIENKLFE